LTVQTVAESSYFLPPYDLRKADAAVKALRQRLAEERPAATPQRRPFGFSKAVKRTSAMQNACSAASTADTNSTAERQNSSGAEGSGTVANGEQRGLSGAAPAAQEGRQASDPLPGRCEA
jgi:hypothetical protein